MNKRSSQKPIGNAANNMECLSTLGNQVLLGKLTSHTKVLMRLLMAGSRIEKNIAST